MSNENNNGWGLQELSIKLMTYGEFNGKYVGKVSFQNKTNDAFMFNLSPERTQKYLELIQEELVDSANHLGEKLLSSLNLLPAPTEQPTLTK